MDAINKKTFSHSRKIEQRLCQGLSFKKKVTNSSSFLIEDKKDDEELPALKIKIKRLQERHPVLEDFKIRVWAKMLVSP